MTDNHTEINNKAARQLEWEEELQGKYESMWWPPMTTNVILNERPTKYFLLRDMHFHDSYDWAFLLVKKAHLIAMDLTETLHDMFDVYWEEATPLQITQACLEVLEDK